jgi:hypothetical protein
MRIRQVWLTAILAFCLIVIGCSSGPSDEDIAATVDAQFAVAMTATAEAAPTATPTATRTPLSTSTPIPTLTPTATATPEPTCADHLTAYLDEAQPILDAFDAADSLAQSTPRQQLVVPIAQLQEQRLEMAKIDVNECLVELHDLYLDYMDKRIEGHIETMEHNNQAVQDKLSDLKRSAYFVCALTGDNICQRAQDLTTDDVDIRAGDATLASAAEILTRIERLKDEIEAGIE